MITKVSCHFCSSRCGLLLNIENDKAVKLAKAPCERSCPAGIDAPRYLRLIADCRFDDAISVIRERVPFPGVLGCVCTHPCETECRRGESDEPLSIRALKYFVAKQDKGVWKKKAKVARPTKKRVAIVGSGPAGLTAGYYLAKLGHGVTVFETLPVVGGMLRVGIPEYRLPREVLEREIEDIKSVGVEIKTNSKVESLDELFKQRYNAIFIGVGAQRGIKLDIDGDESPQVKDCITFLKQVNLGQKVVVGDKVAVIGGGYAAIDASRAALRLGAEEVTIFYRRTRDEMLASQEEINETLAEGIKIQFLTAPFRITNQGNKVRLTCIRMKLGATDESGRRRPEPIEGSKFSLEFNTIIAAIGQQPEIPKGFKLATNPGNTIQVDQHNLATNREGIFAGGDVVTSSASVIEAIAEGRQAAISIDKYLGGSGNIDEMLVSPWVEMTPSGMGEVEGFKYRTPVNMLPIAKRTEGFAQVELGFDKEKAIEEAKRCLWCDLAEGDTEHPLSHGWSCKRGRAHTSRRYQ